MQKFISVLVAVAALGACGRVDNSSSSVKATDFDKAILICDRGAVKIFVNTLERRNLKAEITDPRINAHIRKVSGLKLLDGRGNASTIHLDGYAKEGVFFASSFSGFLGETHEDALGPRGPASVAVQSRVYREGSGLKIEIFRQIVQSTGEGGSVFLSPLVPVANWKFQTCQILP